MADPMTNDISERAERGEDAAVLLRELAVQIWGTYVLPDHSDWLDGIFTDEQKRWHTFGDLLEIGPEAYLAAAVMLKDPAYGYSIQRNFCVLKMPGDGRNIRRKDVCARGPSDAHALIAALARSNPDA